jgi:peptidyl-prolyl cis-trans isomerase D
MRRNLIPVAVLALGLLGCGNFRDLFSAHADVAAEASGQSLSAERLGQILAAGGKNVKPNRETAEYVANVWVDYTLFGDAVAQHRLPTDSAGIAEAMWPEISELKGGHWHDSLMARRSTVSQAAVDSLYDSDTRVLQHILFTVRPNTEAGLRAAAKSKAEATLAQIRKGADFGALATQLSQDPGSKADSGYLPPSPKGRFVPAFDSAGWTLAPGAVSGLVETPFGYHILKRPSKAEAEPRLRAFLVSRAGVQLDSLYMDSLATANKIEVVSGASAAMRSALESPEDSRGSTKALVRYTGGTFPVKEFLRWVRALPPQYSAQLKQADDSVLNRFAKILTQNQLLLEQADANKISITPAEWGELRAKFETQIDTLRSEMELSGGDVTDSAVTLAERQKVAGLKVERYFDQLIGGKARLRPLPSALAQLLRERLSYDIHDAGINRAVEIAAEQRSKSDSTAPKGAMQRAPGPPPVPGQAAPPVRDSVKPK